MFQTVIFKTNDSEINVLKFFTRQTKTISEI